MLLLLSLRRRQPGMWRQYDHLLKLPVLPGWTEDREEQLLMWRTTGETQLLRNYCLYQTHVYILNLHWPFNSPYHLNMITFEILVTKCIQSQSCNKFKIHTISQFNYYFFISITIVFLKDVLFTWTLQLYLSIQYYYSIIFLYKTDCCHTPVNMNCDLGFPETFADIPIQMFSIHNSTSGQYGSVLRCQGLVDHRCYWVTVRGLLQMDWEWQGSLMVRGNTHRSQNQLHGGQLPLINKTHTDTDFWSTQKHDASH